jgi:hypothetical protein
VYTCQWISLEVISTQKGILQWWIHDSGYNFKESQLRKEYQTGGYMPVDITEESLE